MTVQDSLNESDAIAENIKSRPSVGGEKSKKKKKKRNDEGVIMGLEEYDCKGEFEGKGKWRSFRNQKVKMFASGSASFVDLAHQIAAPSSGCLTALAWPDVYITAMEHMGA